MKKINSFEVKMASMILLYIGIEICSSMLIKTFASGPISMAIITISVLLGFSCLFLFKENLNAILFCLITSIIGFKAGPSMESSGLIHYNNIIFNEFDNPTPYFFIYTGALISCIFFKIEKISLIKSLITVGFFLMLRFIFYEETHKISYYQEICDFFILIFLMSVYLQFKKNSPTEQNKIFSCFKILFIFSIIEIIGSFIPVPWAMSYRGGLSGFLLNSEQQLSYLIIIGLVFAWQYDINKYIKTIIIFIMYLGLYLTYNKSGFILSLFIPLIIILYKDNIPSIKIIIIFFLSTVIMYIYSGISGREELMTVAARLLSLTNPIDAFLHSPFFGIGPSISSTHQLSMLTILSFDFNIFKYLEFLNNNENINSTMLYIQQIKDYSNIPPSGPHIFGFQLIYSLGAIGAYFLYITYFSLPNIILKDCEKNNHLFLNIIFMILIAYSFFHPQNIIFILLLASLARHKKC